MNKPLIVVLEPQKQRPYRPKTYWSTIMTTIFAGVTMTAVYCYIDPSIIGYFYEKVPKHVLRMENTNANQEVYSSEDHHEKRKI